jgi:hypothetical protein
MLRAGYLVLTLPTGCGVLPEGDPMNWHKQIRAARNWQELLAVARDFVAHMTPEEIGTLPPTCREMRIKGVDDVYFWHERLAEEFFDRASRGDPSPAHRDMLDFFTVASERASELCGSASDENATNEGFLESQVRGGKRVLH